MSPSNPETRRRQNREAAARYRARHPERRTHQQSTHNRYRRYGVTAEEYDRLRENQNYQCAICDKPEQEERFQSLHVDHCHTTKKVRGLLCMKCNSVLGFCGDSIPRLHRAIAYIEKYQ